MYLSDTVPRPGNRLSRVFYCNVYIHVYSLVQTADGGYITMTANKKPSTVVVYHATTLTNKRYAIILEY